jgi:hypothetical protein
VDSSLDPRARTLRTEQRAPPPAARVPGSLSGTPDERLPPKEE